VTKRKKDDRLRLRTSCLCVYCLMRTADHMIQLRGGTANGAPSKRWMCGPCIVKRRLVGALKLEQNMYVRAR
jgi:hypothetical protein